MTDSSLKNTVMAKVALGLVPPLIRESLLSDQHFRQSYGFKADALISFDGSGVSIQRSKLFTAVRAVLAGVEESEILDFNDSAWKLRNEANKEKLPNLVLISTNQRLILPNFAVLSNDPSIRIRSLDEAASDVNLPVEAREKWRSILTERPLEDDEVDLFCSEFRDTPVNMERTILSEIKLGQSSISSLVPNSLRYYERLVGIYDGSPSIKDYAAGAGRKLFDNMSDWRPYKGFLFSLLLSSHSFLTTEISVDRLDSEKLSQAFGFIERHGDILSRLGAFEVGLRILPVRPEIEPFLLHLVHRIRDDDVEGNQSEFGLFSALFVLVDGELSRKHLMIKMPPFYRRLASLAQAALIHRQIVQSDIDYEPFIKWAISNRGKHYYMQSFVDMRTEPRWYPDLGAAFQIRADFLGRIMIAGRNYEGNIGTEDLHDTVIGDGPNSLYKACEFPRQYLPGPLEGAIDNPNSIPDDLAAAIEQQLGVDQIEASSFIAIVNAAMICRIKTDHAELAAKALRLGKYRLAKLEKKSHLLAILVGLANVAAVSRKPSLADELRILVRRYCHDAQFRLTIQEAMRICFVACAAHEELLDWRNFAGEWLTELAFSDLEGDEGEVFHSQLITLLDLVPELWYSCAKAEAALRAWCAR